MPPTHPSGPYRICPNPTAPTFDRLFGWRYYLNKWFGIEFKRARFVFFSPDRRLICSPESVPVVATWLRSRGLPYVVETKLAAVPTEAKK